MQNKNKPEKSKRQIISLFAFSILITIIITAIDWEVTNFYNIALYEGDSEETVREWFILYQITIFIIAGGLILLFFMITQVNYISRELELEIKGLHYIKFLKEIPKERKLEIILPSLAFGILFLFNFEDILWFRLFYGPRMSSVIDNFQGDMWWLDFHLAGWIGTFMGFGGATSLSLMIISSIGYVLFCLIWYKLIQDKLLFINLAFCILFIFNIDIVFIILGFPFPYLRISLMEILYFISLIIITIKNTK